MNDAAPGLSVKNHFETADQAIYAATEGLFKQLKEKQINVRLITYKLGPYQRTQPETRVAAGLLQT